MDFTEWRDYDVDEDGINVRKNYEEPNGSKTRRMLIKTLIVLGGIAAAVAVVIAVLSLS